MDILSQKSKGLFYFGIVISILSAPFFMFIIPTFITAAFGCLAAYQYINIIAINYGFGQKDLYDYGLDKYIYERDKNEKFGNEQIQKLEKKCKSLLEDILYYTGPIQCLIKAKEFTHQIINLIDELSNKNENGWNTFQVEKI